MFQEACVEAGIPAVSFWAAVPHYVSQAPSPKATLALSLPCTGSRRSSTSRSDLGALPSDQADEWEAEVTQIAAEDEEIAEYIRALEERQDAEAEPLDRDLR